jgi:hypothetical protein
MPANVSLAQMAPDPVLSNIAIQSATGGPFIADRLLPVRTVPLDYGRYTIWGRENIIPDVPIKRAFGAPAKRTSISRSYTAFNISSDRSLTIPIADEILNNSPNPAGVEAQRLATIMNRLRMDIEIDAAALVAAIATGADPTVKFDAASGVIIEKCIDVAKEAFFLQFGMEPNTILIPVPIARVMKRDATVRTQIQYTHADLLVNGDLPPVLWNLNVVIPGAITKTTPDVAITRIWGANTITLLYVDPGRPDEDTNTWGLQIRSPVGAGLQIAAYRWRDPDPTAATSYVAAAIKQTELVVNAALGYKITNVLT